MNQPLRKSPVGGELKSYEDQLATSIDNQIQTSVKLKPEP